MMRMSFYLGANFTDLLFKDWDNHTDAGLFGACVVFFVCSCLLELIRELLMYCKHESVKNPLTYARTPENISRTPEMMRSLIIPDHKHIRKRRIMFHLIRTGLHMVQYALGMCVMLAVMYYNAWFLISVIIGAGVGYFFWALIHFRYEYQDAKMEKAQKISSNAGLGADSTLDSGEFSESHLPAF